VSTGTDRAELLRRLARLAEGREPCRAARMEGCEAPCFAGEAARGYAGAPHPAERFFT